MCSEYFDKMMRLYNQLLVNGALLFVYVANIPNRVCVGYASFSLGVLLVSINVANGPSLLSFRFVLTRPSRTLLWRARDSSWVSPSTLRTFYCLHEPRPNYSLAFRERKGFRFQ